MLVLVNIAFVTFVYLNGGVALGHQEFHAFSLHWGQIPYFFLFSVPFMQWTLKDFTNSIIEMIKPSLRNTIAL